MQGLTLALIGLLRTRYAIRLADASSRIGKFGSRDAERLREFIADELAGDLRIGAWQRSSA